MKRVARSRIGSKHWNAQRSLTLPWGRNRRNIGPGPSYWAGTLSQRVAGQLVRRPWRGHSSAAIGRIRAALRRSAAQRLRPGDWHGGKNPNAARSQARQRLDECGRLRGARPRGSFRPNVKHSQGDPMRALCSFALLTLIAGPVQAQRPGSNPITGLDGYIQDALTKFKGVGLAIAVVRNDSIVYAKGFGPKRLGEPAPVTPQTIFAIGSTTKAFTTTALGMLVDEGRFGWDTRATDVMKGFELYDPAVTREITIRDLLTHRSGLSRGDMLWMGSNFTRAEVIRRVRYHQPTWSLRTTWGYQNIMYLTAGEMIPAVTGRSWDDFLQARIFRPLGMTSTNTTTMGLDTLPDVATPHIQLDGKIVKILADSTKAVEFAQPLFLIDPNATA
ncbi:MAG: hypothetical protein E8D45_07505 [Nitrospira sp.]|nr:MAG: hypothetical protein E8D45_07505 [Nitrospira sp.]